MIKYTIEETTTNTCPPPAPAATPCRCSRCNGGGSSTSGRAGQHPAVEFIAGTLGLVVLYFLLKFVLFLIFRH